jgi:hypothetical protein
MKRRKRKTAWRLWASALGEKAGKNDAEANIVAAVRTLIFITYFVTNLFIVAGVIRHWNDADYSRPTNIEVKPF